MLNKKGAMFGLDARIALAIFGALSVISGAALYSAIQESKVVAFIVENEEISKAYDAYRLDVGKDLDVVGGSTDTHEEHLKFRYLVEDSTETGWKGPYLSYSTFNTPNSLTNIAYLEKKPYTTFGLRRYQDVTNGAGSAKLDLCTASSECSAWVIYMPVETSFANALEKKVDNTIDFEAGKVRSFEIGGNRFLLMKIADEF